MAVVAVVGLILGGYLGGMRLTRTAQVYRKKSIRFAGIEKYLRQNAAYLNDLANESRARRNEATQRYVEELDRYVEELDGLSKAELRRADLYHRLALKYKAAASHPWTSLPSVPPDPSEILSMVTEPLPPTPIVPEGLPPRDTEPTPVEPISPTPIAPVQPPPRNTELTPAVTSPPVMPTPPPAEPPKGY